MGFAWKLDGVTQYFVFTVLPFGLATACYVFTKLMRPLVRRWRGKGLRAIVYIDDGIVAVKGKDKAVTASQQVQKDLLLAGWVVNVKKSQWEPDRSIRWLGFELDLEQGQIRVPRHKMVAMKECLHLANSSLRVPAKLLQAS